MINWFEYGVHAKQLKPATAEGETFINALRLVGIKGHMHSALSHVIFCDDQSTRIHAFCTANFRDRACKVGRGIIVIVFCFVYL